MILSEYIKEVLYDTMLTIEEKYIKINKYVHFITQHLKLSDFITAKLVDGKWVVLEEPEKGYDFDAHNLASAKEEYQQAVDNLVFKGFVDKENFYWNENDTIENLLGKAELTDKIKQKYGI